MEFDTRAIHVGQDPDPTTGAVVVPIYQTTTFAQEDPLEHRGYAYARTSNPTRTALEQCLASLEGAAACAAFGSGMAAVDAVLRLLQPGEHLLVPDDVYQGTWRLVTDVLVDWGVTSTPVDLGDLDQVAAAFTPATRLVWAESPSNPLLRIIDIPAVAELAHSRGAILVVDNTFATPYLQRPLELGADIVVHSTTKYLGGHSDVVGGAVCGDQATVSRLTTLRTATGGVPGPFDAWLTLRGIKTLGVRMRQHCANAAAVASFLAAHPRVRRVRYPGLDDDPGHAVARRQMRGFGGMVSIHVEGGREAALRVARSTRVFVLAESLGGVESLIQHSRVMMFGALPGPPREVPDDLLRLSVGIEDIDDLLADLESALG